MKKSQKLFSLYPYVTAALVVMMCLLVCPLQLIGHTAYESSSLETGIFPNLDLTDGSIAISEFSPSHKHLDRISLRFLSSGSAPDGTVTLELYDSMQQKLCEVSLPSGSIMNYRWISFPLDVELEAGETYTWLLRACDYDPEKASLSLYTGGASTAPDESGAFYYNGSREKNWTPAVIFSYTDRADIEHAMPYYIVIFLIGLLLFTACSKFEKTNEDTQP